MKTVEITHEGFHGLRTASIRPRKSVMLGDSEYYVVSRRVGERLNRLACGGFDSNCQCGEVWATPHPWSVGADPDDFTEMIVQA